MYMSHLLKNLIGSDDRYVKHNVYKSDVILLFYVLFILL